MEQSLNTPLVFELKRCIFHLIANKKGEFFWSLHFVLNCTGFSVVLLFQRLVSSSYIERLCH
jgi:hypothetical protein